MSQLPALPRELIDQIISSLIALYDNDPAYQWTQLRHITRRHKAHLEQHFLGFWVPKLSFQIGKYCTSPLSAEFQARRQPCTSARRERPRSSAFRLHAQKALSTAFLPLLRCTCCLWPYIISTSRAYASYSVCDQKLDEKHEDTDIITFGEMWHLRPSDLPQGWLEKVRKSNDRYPWEQSDCDVIVRFGEGTLNRGYIRGGMMNDIVIPGLSINVDTWPWELSFDWKALFTRLFTEEMVLRTFRDKLLEVFVPSLEEEGTSLELRKSAIHYHLSNHFYDQRRHVLSAYRRYRYSYTHDDGHSYKARTPTQPFDFTPYVYRGGKRLYTNQHRIFEDPEYEESMVFQVPGWETLSIRDIVQLRVGEEMTEHRFFWPEDLHRFTGQVQGFLCKEFLEDCLQEGRGRQVASDEVLEKRLVDKEFLDLESFWV